MKFAVVLLTSILVISTCEGRTLSRTTEAICPLICPLRYRPVCVRDGSLLLWFSNSCLQWKCECKINRVFENVDMDDCDNRITAPPRDSCPSSSKPGEPPHLEPTLNVEDSQSLSGGQE